jgi:hypothetical protein
MSGSNARFSICRDPSCSGNFAGYRLSAALLIRMMPLIAPLTLNLDMMNLDSPRSR